MALHRVASGTDAAFDSGMVIIGLVTDLDERSGYGFGSSVVCVDRIGTGPF